MDLHRKAWGPCGHAQGTCHKSARTCSGHCHTSAKFCAGTFLRSSGRILHIFTGDIRAYQRSVPERFCFFSQLICSFSGHFQPDADIQAGWQSFLFENRRIRWVPARPPQICPTGKEISDTLKNFLSNDILIFIFIMSEEGRKR